MRQEFFRYFQHRHHVNAGLGDDDELGTPAAPVAELDCAWAINADGLANLAVCNVDDH